MINEPKGLNAESISKLCEMIPHLEIGFARKIVSITPDHINAGERGIWTVHNFVIQWIREQLFKDKGVDASLDSHHVNIDGIVSALYSRWRRYYIDNPFTDEESEEKYNEAVERLKSIVI